MYHIAGVLLLNGAEASHDDVFNDEASHGAISDDEASDCALSDDEAIYDALFPSHDEASHGALSDDETSFYDAYFPQSHG